MKLKNKMAEKKKEQQSPIENDFVFTKKNYLFMLIGIGVIALGFILMIGGGSDDPNIFNPALYNFQRIRLAPTLVLIGFGIEVYAILRKN